MRRFFTVDGPLPPLFLPLIGAIIAIAAVRGGPAQAQDKAVPKTKTYVISASEGYGVGDCFKQGGSCGQMVATSWCQARGHGKPAAWGAADDMTASIPAAAKGADKGALVITCNE